MSLENDQSSSSCSEIEDVIFPEEIWIFIWSYLDFKTLQKTCTRVSKSWLEMIRSSKLSWEMKLRNTFVCPDILGVEDFNAMLSQWKDLRVLHFSSEVEFVNLHLSYGLSSHKSLENIVIPCGLGLFTNDTLWGVVTKYWLDPRHIFAPDTVKNAIKLKIYIEEFAMQQNGCDFSNLETLEIHQYPTSEKNSFLTAMLRRRSWDVL